MDSSMISFLNPTTQKVDKPYSKETIGKDNKVDKGNQIVKDFKSTIDEAQEKVKKADQDETYQKIDIQRKAFKNVSSVIEQVGIKEDLTLEDTSSSLEMMMQILMSQLNLSQEQIEEILSSQGITLDELTQEETFRQFVMNALETDEVTLLSDPDQMKTIKQLWEAFKAIESTNGQNKQIVTKEMVIEDGKVVEETTTVEVKKIDEEAAIDLQNIPEVIESVRAEVSHVPGVNKKVEGDTAVDEPIVLGRTQIGMGMTIPIQALAQDQPTYLWKEAQSFPTTHMNQDLANPVHSQIIEKFHYTELQTAKEIQMDLAPKELGKLSLKMVEQNGVITAQIKVEQDKTKELIMQNIESLKEGFEKQGLSIADVQVEVKKDPHQSQMEKEKQKSVKRIQELISKHMETDLEAERVEHSKIDTLTSIEVDYKA